MPPLYEPLDIGSYEIRLITLHPGQAGSLIEGTLEKHSLLDAPTYYALSYCWGSESVTKDLQVNNTRISATVNLEDALQQLRQKNITRVWADALCINQSDEQEKSIQIRMMNQIYARARTTYVWIGTDEASHIISAVQFLSGLSPQEANDTVLRAVERDDDNRLLSESLNISNPSRSAEEGLLNQQGGAEPACQSTSLESSLEVMGRLCRNEYFQRRWILQEITVSIQVRFLCGRSELPLEDLRSAFNTYEAAEARRRNDESASRYLRQILDLRQEHRYGEALKLMNTILATREFLSRDAKDQIFAILGMCSDGTDLVPAPSYHQTLNAILRNLSRELIRRYACLEIILVDERPQAASTEFPTWAPNWLSPDLPPDAGESANSVSRFPRSFGARSLDGDVATLLVEGAILGTIIHIVPGVPSSAPNLSVPGRQVDSTRRKPSEYRTYYGDTPLHVLSAVLHCLLATSCQPMSDFHSVVQLRNFRNFISCNVPGAKAWTRKVLVFVGATLLSGIVAWGVIQLSAAFRLMRSITALLLTILLVSMSLLSILLFTTIPSRMLLKGCRNNGAFLLWFREHEDFPIYGHSLRHWLLESPSYYWSYQLSMQSRWSELKVLNRVLFCTAMVVAAMIIPAYHIFYSVTILMLYYFIAAAFLVLSVFKIPEVFVEMARLQCDLETMNIAQRRLSMADNGMLAMTPMHAGIGDKICFLAGCTSAAVLRECGLTSDGIPQYWVIGKAFVCLNKQDKKKYLAFMNSEADAQTCRKLFEEYQKEDWWQKLVLI